MPELFVAGRWRGAADGSLVATASEGGADDAAAAARAARDAFDNGPWPTTPAPERAALPHRVADRLEADTEEVARRKALDTGKRMVESGRGVDPAAPGTVGA